MSLPQSLSPITDRIAHILTARRTARTLAARSGGETAILGIFFAGPVGDIYQVTQWLSVFEKMEDELPSVLLVKDARAAAALAQLTNLPIRIAGHADAIEPLVPRLGLKALLYVNNNLANFSALRLSNVTHIHLSHGESEKVSMVSNQLKAYDHCFIAGQASADRITSSLQLFDATRLKLIGRPQLEDLLSASIFQPVPGRTTVLYAPTWEGDRPAMAYGSVASAGLSWVTTVLGDPTLRLVYRPHPKTGARCKETRQADSAIKKLIADFTAQSPDAGHFVDTQADYNAALASADIGIFDVSAMAMDFSILNRPYLVSCPESLEDSLRDSPLWSVARKIVPEHKSDLGRALHAALLQGPLPGAERFVTDHFGTTNAGDSFNRFVSALKATL